MFAAACPVQADTVWESGHHEINDGDLYGEIWMHNDCTLDILGGDIEACIVNIYGGNLEDDLAATDNSIINLYAYDVEITQSGGWWDDGQVTGKYYSNDEPFNFDLWGQNTYQHINIVPEPMTLLFLASGFMGIRRRN
jgi:hypothetical protein